MGFHSTLYTSSIIMVIVSLKMAHFWNGEWNVKDVVHIAADWLTVLKWLRYKQTTVCCCYSAVFVKMLGVLCQEAEVNSSSNEMDEVMRAVSAETERLLSATRSSQRRRQSSVSIYDQYDMIMLTFNVQLESWQMAGHMTFSAEWQCFLCAVYKWAYLLNQA